MYLYIYLFFSENERSCCPLFLVSLLTKIRFMRKVVVPTDSHTLLSKSYFPVSSRLIHVEWQMSRPRVNTRSSVGEIPVEGGAHRLVKPVEENVVYFVLQIETSK